MIRHCTLILALAAQILSSQSLFSVYDDIFAFPQYEVSLAESYIYENAADHATRTPGDTLYEKLIMHGRPYLCSIPRVQIPSNETDEKPSEDERLNELSKAADRGWELLQDMEGKQCLFYSTGWWSYSFCYNSQVTQFHALPPGTSGARVWPPQEDPTTPSYVLGKEKRLVEKALQTKAESTYLIQKLVGGTPCDLTGEDRTIEIEFHCHPQSTDRIGWIKETSTCAYLMIVYTPRLCNDVAFQPAKGAQVHTVSCQRIIADIDSASVEAPAESIVDERMIVGDIEIGAMKHVGQDGKRVEKGRIVMTSEERAEVVVMQKGGQVQSLTKHELRKMNLDPDKVEAFRKELAELAGNKDWKIERIDEGNKVQLRGVVSPDEVKKKDEEEEDSDSDSAGSQEDYKNEI